MPSRDTNTGAKRAREVRTKVGIDAGAALGCVLTLVERSLSLPVVLAALPAGIAGCCWRDGDRVVLWVNGTQSVPRMRFTLAHELGHIRCGHDADVPVETFETLGGQITDSREIQANAFAAELLAPAEGVRAMISSEPSLDEVVLVAARFGTSTIAALYRLNSLGLTSRYEVLKGEIDESLQDAVWERLRPQPVDDVIARADGMPLPRMSSALDGSALAALSQGAASIADAAAMAGCDPGRLATGAAAIGV